MLARRLEIRSKITSALVYPIILILMSLVSVVVIVFVLIPSISPIFIDAGLPLPGILHIFAEIQDNWLMVLLALVLCGARGFVLWGKAKQNAEIMLGVDRLKCSLPVIGRLIRAPRSRRLCAGARHAARCKGSADVGDADRAGAGDQPAPECAL